MIRSFNSWFFSARWHCAQPRRHLGFWDPPHISRSTSERQL